MTQHKAKSVASLFHDEFAIVGSINSFLPEGRDPIGLSRRQTEKRSISRDFNARRVSGGECTGLLGTDSDAVHRGNIAGSPSYLDHEGFESEIFRTLDGLQQVGVYLLPTLGQLQPFQIMKLEIQKHSLFRLTFRRVHTNDESRS